MILENIDIDMVILENIDIDIDIDKAILQNIDIDKISNQFKFGISNRAIRACIDCITRIHAVSQNIIQYLNWVKSRVVFMQEIEGGTNHSTLPCPRTSGS